MLRSRGLRGARGVAMLATLAVLIPKISDAQAAARPDAGAPLRTLAEVYASLDASPRLAAAAAGADAALAMVAEAGTLMDPQLQLAFMNRELPGLAPMAPLGMTQLQLMQMVPVSGRLRRLQAAATAQASASGFDATAVRWEERARVGAAFLAVWRADRATEILAETQQVMLQMENVARALYAVGEGRNADVLRARVQVERMSQDLLMVAAERRGAVARVNGLLNRAHAATVEPEEVPLTSLPIPEVDTLVALAEARRPALRGAAARVTAAEASLDASRRLMWPDLQVGVAYGQRGAAGMTERMGSLMLGSTLPIHASRRQLAARREQEAMLAMAQAELQAMRAETRAMLEERVAELQKAQALQALYRERILPQAAATVESSLAAYRAGDLPFLALAESQVALNEFRLALVALIGDEGRIWAELEALVATALVAPGER